MKFLSHNLSHSHEEHKQFCSQANKKDIWLDELKPASNYQQVDILIKFIQKNERKRKNFNLMMRSSFALFCCICLSGSLFGFYFHIHDDIQTIWTNFLLWNSITRMRQKSFCSNGWDLFGRLSLVVMRSCASMAFMKQIEVTIKYELTMQGHFQWASWSYQGINQRPNYNVHTCSHFIAR